MALHWFWNAVWYGQFIILVAGIFFSAWGFKKSRKSAYILFGVYFLLPFVLLIARPVLPVPSWHDAPPVEAFVQEDPSDPGQQVRVPVVTVTRTYNVPRLIILVAVFLLVLREQQVHRNQDVAVGDTETDTC